MLLADASSCCFSLPRRFAAVLASRSRRDLLLLPPPLLLVALRFFGGGARVMQPWQYHLPRGTFSSGGM